MPRARSSDDLPEVALAAPGGRVRTLLVDADLTVPGTADHATGRVTLGERDDPHTDDEVDDLADLAIRMGGEVVVIPHNMMPSVTGVAAI